MKSLLTGFTALVVALSLSAFTIQDSNVKEGGQNIRFASTDASGVVDTSPDIFTGTIAGARQHYNCPDGTPTFCARQVDNANNALPAGVQLLKN